ncbi:MAG: universal stress protein [Cyanobacteriota bacterium]|nr:universal stress protein [Cyanobacteriota bacterium]
MFQRALICTDLTDSIYRLAQFVPSLAAGGLKSLVFFHSVALETEREIPRHDPELLEGPRQQLQALLRQVPEGVDARVEVQSGRASDNILRLAKQCHADVIFLGTATRTLLEEKLFGSTTLQLSEKTEVPLVILRPQLLATYTTAELDLRCSHLFRYLLLPYDGRQGSQTLVDRVRHQVQNNPDSVLERIRLLWVVDENIRPELLGDHPLEDAQDALATVQAELAALGLVVNLTVVTGDPLKQILAAAEAHDIGAIAIASRGLGGLLKWSAPSLSRELMRHCWHPLLFFPS